MNKEYIIISKTDLEKRIKELENYISNTDFEETRRLALIGELEDVLFRSIPLIPEIGKSYDAGRLDEKLTRTFDNPKGRYINNLKLENL